jgi:hypothetical protein
MWVILNLTLGPLSFRILGLPILHDFAASFTLLLTAWATGKLGTASFEGVVGSVIVILAGGPLVVAAFAVSSALFDILMSLSNHKLDSRIYNITVAALAATVSAYFAGVIISVLFTQNSPGWALTYWGPWHLIGGAISLAITLPILSSRKSRGEES